MVWNGAAAAFATIRTSGLGASYGSRPGAGTTMGSNGTFRVRPGRASTGSFISVLAVACLLGGCRSGASEMSEPSATTHTAPDDSARPSATPSQPAQAPAHVAQPAARPPPASNGPASEPASVRITLSNGLIIDELRMGDGDACLPDSRVIVRYTGRLAPNGTVVDNSPPSAPRVFELKRMIRGWREGLLGMRIGGVRRLTIPPDLAYGAEGYPRLGIPPDATLVYDIELAGLGAPSTSAQR